MYFFIVCIIVHNSFAVSLNKQKQKKENRLSLGEVVTPHFDYLGGHVLSNVEVFPIYYGYVPDQNKIDSFYKAIVNSHYIDWLSEYNTPTQKIGKGSFIGSYSHLKNLRSFLNASDLSHFMFGLVKNGIIKPNENSYYPIHFAPNITLEGACSIYCAFHSTYDISSIYNKTKYLYYGVHPDLSGACNGFCGTSNVYENTCMVASHELVEAITDPGIGVGDISWYDLNFNGEIGDVCNAWEDYTLGSDGKTYRIQREWSNLEQKCINTRDPTKKMTTTTKKTTTTTKKTTTTTKKTTTTTKKTTTTTKKTTTTTKKTTTTTKKTTTTMTIKYYF